MSNLFPFSAFIYSYSKTSK